MSLRLPFPHLLLVFVSSLSHLPTSVPIRDITNGDGRREDKSIGSQKGRWVAGEKRPMRYGNRALLRLDYLIRINSNNGEPGTTGEFDK